MLLKLITLLLVGCTLANTAAVVPHQKIQADFNKVFMDSQNFLQNNPDRYQECFDYYRPPMTQAGKDYEDGVNTCSSNAEQNRTNINDSGYVSATRSDVSKPAASVCYQLDACEKYQEALEAFQCYSTHGNDGSNTLNQIKFLAVEAVEKIQNLLNNIKSEETMCVNLADTTYKKDWSILTEKLQACFTSNEPLYSTTTAARVTTDRPSTTLV